MTTGPEGWRAVLEPATWVACGVTKPEHRGTDGTAWTCLEAVDPDPVEETLTIVVGWGGGGRYDHTEVVETNSEVRVRVLIEHHVPTDPTIPIVRTAELRTAVVEVHLSAPMGGRMLIGRSEGPVARLLSKDHWVPADRPPIEVVTSGRQTRT
jgi:hypothetical protein